MLFFILLNANSPLSLLDRKLTSDESEWLSNITVANGIGWCNVSCKVPLMDTRVGFWACAKKLKQLISNRGRKILNFIKILFEK